MSDDSHGLKKLTHRELQALADRLYSRGISTIMRDLPEQQADLIAASRSIRALMRLFETVAGHSVQTVFLCNAEDR